MLNTFFGLMANEPPEVADTFIKDRTDWFTFTRLALIAARKNPALLIWILEMAGSKDLILWLGSYLTFNLDALRNLLLAGWFPGLWLKLLSLNYQLRHSTNAEDSNYKVDKNTVSS